MLLRNRTCQALDRQGQGQGLTSLGKTAVLDSAAAVTYICTPDITVSECLLKQKKTGPARSILASAYRRPSGEITAHQ